MDIWETIKKWFEDVVLPIDDEYWEDEPKAKTPETSKKSTKSSESP